jgi:trigger factor
MEKELPPVDDVFAQLVGEYADLAGLRATIASQLREREEERVRQELEEAALDKLVELSTLEFPPQLVEHEAEHLMERFAENVERQGLKLDQFLRLTGRDEEAFREEFRTQAETRLKRALALDAFAEAEHIEVEPEEVDEEVRRAAASTPEAEATEMLARNNPTTMARVERATRERKALERLLAQATGAAGDGGEEKSTAETPSSEGDRASDTGQHSEEMAAGSTAGETRGNA